MTAQARWLVELHKLTILRTLWTKANIKLVNAEENR